MLWCGTVKQVQIALELYYADRTSYPVIASPGLLGAGIKNHSVAMAGKPVLAVTPPIWFYTAPTPADGSCSRPQNGFTYPGDRTSYTLNFCLEQLWETLGQV